MSRIPFNKTLLAAGLLTAIGAPIANAQSGLVLEEVIVTAQKREQSVQDISATVNVVTGDVVDKFSVFSFEDIDQLTAGLTIQAPTGRNGTISLRGVGIDPESGTASVVDVYWNSVVVRPDNVLQAMYDLERLEVLRGPQGTLQGRTSPAGAIDMITRRPSWSEAEGYVQLSASDDKGFNGQVAYGAPIIEDVLAVRVAGLYETSEGAGIENLVTGTNNPEDDTESVRITLSYAPTDTFTAHLTYQHHESETNDNQLLVGTDALGVRPTLTLDDRETLFGTDAGTDLEYDLTTLNMTWEVAGHEFTSITGYNDSDKLSRQQNADRAGYNTVPNSRTNQFSNTLVESFVQEFRIASLDNDFWDYMVGLYYIDQDTETLFSATRSLEQPAVNGIIFTTVGDIPVGNEEISLYTFHKLYLTEATQLEVGLRYSEFDRSRAANVRFGEFLALPDAVSAFAPVIMASSMITGISEENQQEDSDAITGSLTLRHELNDDTSVYASYNRGYRPGGISIVPTPNVAFLPNGENDLLHGEEESDSLEIGFKSRLLDGAATLNGAIFHQEYDGYFGFKRGLQVLNASGNPVGLTGGIIYNGDATITGIDLEGQILLSEQLSAGASLSYVQAEWDGAQEPCNDREPGEVLGFCDVDGENVADQPEFSFSANAEYFIPTDGMEWYIRGLYKYVGERDNNDAAAGLLGVSDEFDAYHSLNLFTGVRSVDAKWDVSVWAKNFFDDDTIIREEGPDGTDITASGGSYRLINTVQPRTIGITGRYNF
ncbi:MAG: TonB-dependent receptor [Halioglobus sp.]